jgi:hypothetical protein
MHVVLIETSGNQAYIFATNRLRENVGASELIYRVGTNMVLEAVAKLTDNRINLYENDDPTGWRLRENLLDKKKNPELVSGGQVEVITATSGKALLLVETEEIGRALVKQVTERALLDMPGLAVHGAISSEFTCREEIHEPIKEVHRNLESIRYRKPGNEQRYLRLPLTAPCDSTGFPASRTYEFKNEQTTDAFTFSNVTIAKRMRLAEKKERLTDEDVYLKDRIATLLEETFKVKLPSNLAKLEEAFPETDWLAVVHADGNGLGQIFLKLDEYLNGRDYIDSYRKFSIALDVCTINAAGYASKKLERSAGKRILPIVPLILGGDDLTFLCSGRAALRFCVDFLTQFEEETKEISNALLIGDEHVELSHPENILQQLRGVIPSIAKCAFGRMADDPSPLQGLSACAGIAIVKLHYPFHQAYHLTEQLLRSAKDVKRHSEQPCSALDFHILYDSAHADLDDIRKRLKPKREEIHLEETFLYAKPYIVREPRDVNNGSNKWFQHRKFKELSSRIEALKSENDNHKRLLPAGKMHELRESMFRSRPLADLEVDLIRSRLDDEAQDTFNKLLVTEKSLFFEDGAIASTHFLDALEAVEFWTGSGDEKTQPESESKL